MSKNIILCSDGTGNRWGVGNQTNVSRLYEAVETKGSDPRQVKFYDNGVGTSSNKYIKAITGAFGIGLERNVLDLYEFLARHWEQYGEADYEGADPPQDNVYVFGFSRGAATVRAFAGMVQVCGLLWVESQDPDGKRYDELAFQGLIVKARDLYRKRRKKDWTRERRQQALEDAIAAANDKCQAQNGPYNCTFRFRRGPKIRMIGVWDTVSALGFPQDWSWVLQYFFRAMEWMADLMFPHRYYNYRLDQGVENAYHALALDDERKTFKPMLWNEQDDERPENLQQVWFAGMHSDVGGGYPRAGLSTVALDWMMAHASGHGIRFAQNHRQKARDDANVHGKMHDSRDGFAVYYRYQPRDLVALCHTPEKDETKAKVADGAVQIHDTVIDRLRLGTARYATGHLPRKFRVVSTPDPDPDYSSTSAKQVGASTIEQAGERWQADRDEIRKWAKARFWLYRLFVELTLVLVVLALYFWRNPPAIDASQPSGAAWYSIDGVINAGQWVLNKFADLLKWFLPKAVEDLVTVLFVTAPIWLLVLVVAVIALNRLKRFLREGYDRAAQTARQHLLASED